VISETLKGIRSEDLDDPSPEVRRKAYKTFARNERILWGRVSQATEFALLHLEEIPTKSPSDTDGLSK
jgi:hypothetical protein